MGDHVVGPISPACYDEVPIESAAYRAGFKDARKILAGIIRGMTNTGGCSGEGYKARLRIMALEALSVVGEAWLLALDEAEDCAVCGRVQGDLIVSRSKAVDEGGPCDAS